MRSNLDSYSGDWIIIVEKKLRAHGPRVKMKQMLSRVRKKYSGEPIFIVKVPAKTLRVL
jgi:hypothetical protein